jgi:TorA maturation chaperone TorD
MTQLDEEDRARANFYGLIARLFYLPPDAQLLGELVNAQAFDDSESEIAQAWAEMAEGCRNAFPVQLENEHTELFIGTGKAEVTPYLSHYILKHANDAPLVELRQQLDRWGMSRRESAHEPEDHIAGVCETMRLAIAVQHRGLAEQKAFFDRFVHRGAVAFCDAVSASQKARFYRSVARFSRAFFELEREAFEIG